jgi:uncharacterized RDD family membrane protein YckC
MTNEAPEGAGGEAGSWGPEPAGGWGAGWGDPPAGWGSSPPYGQGQAEQAAPGQSPSYGPQPPGYGQPGYGPGLPSYSQFGGPQGNWGPTAQWDGQLASWAQRAGGYIIDAVISGLPTAVLYLAGVAARLAALDVLGVLWGLATWIWFAVQSGQYGSSPGMRVMGLKLVRASTGQTVGGGMGFVRQLLHVVGWALCGLVYILDMLWPLWDSQRQTLADKVVGTVVLRVEPQGFSLLPRLR